jgi:hypothetical protein
VVRTRPSAGFVLYGVREHRGAVIRFVQFAVIVRAGWMRISRKLDTRFA